MNLSIAIKQWYFNLKINKYCLKELEIQKNIVRSGNFTDTFSKVSNKTK